MFSRNADRSSTDAQRAATTPQQMSNVRELSAAPPPAPVPTAPADTTVVARGDRLLGAVVIADTLRAEAAQAIRAIQSLGIRTILLTGDAQAVAQGIAKQLGISEFGADLLPEDKRQRVKELVDKGCTVAMVGDGINDAPALIEAHVGVSMGSGTDVARESADVVLLGNDLLRFAETLAVARRTRRIIWANFVGTIGDRKSVV